MNKSENKNYLLDDAEFEKEGLYTHESKIKNYGVILTFLFSLSDSFFKLLKNGIFGYLFSRLYTKCNEKWKNGFIYRIFKRKSGKGRNRAFIARLYEESLICRIVSGIGKAIINSHMRFWGVGLFSFAFATVFVAMFRFYLIEDIVQMNIVVGIVIAVLSLPFIISKRRVGEALLEGRISRYVIIQILSLDEGKLECDSSSSGNYSLSFGIAALLGFSTYFVDPMLYVHIAAFIIVLAVIMCFPELCITAIISLIPFANVFENPSAAIFVLMILAIMGYILKFIRGKRVLRFELVDVFVLAFAVMLFFGGVFTRGGELSFYSAIIYTVFISIYFLVVNSYIRKTWIYRGIKLIVVFTSLVALIGILEGGVINSSWVDSEMFGDISARVSSFLGNPNMLGVYLVIVFPLAFAQMIVSRKKLSKLGFGICTLLMLVCTILTWSRGAWLGLIASTLIFLVLYDSRNIWFIIAGGASMPMWMVLIPETVIRRFISIFTMSDTSVLYRFNTWRGVLSMIKDNLISGVGVGENAFKEAYLAYAVPGTESVLHSHSLMLQITLELGIIGAIVFVAIMLMYAQKCFATISMKTNVRKSKSKTMIAAGFASICGALTIGLTDHIWYNYRVFLVFWVVMGLTVALMKINEKEKAKEDASVVCNMKSADIDIYL